MELEKYEALSTAKEYSKDILSKLRDDFKDIKEDDFCIVTTGSFARCEASEASDLDCFIIVRDKTKFVIADDLKELLEKIVAQYIEKEAGDTGTFGLEAIVDINELITNIGGADDSNIQFTRRMLFLLEGKYLFNQKLFNEFRQELIEQYIKPTVSDHQLSRFFLNDIIRYYRTMTTDFEHKVSEKGKSWGVRNIKLTFSRKILYFGGIITVAETAQKTREIKVQETLRLLEMSPLERIEYIGNYRVDKVFKHYDYFLEKMSDETIRQELDKAKIENKSEENPSIFREMKNESKHFSLALSSLLEQTYDATHPIHHALIF
jgi:predicted nucleotidyltransferase